MMGKVERTCTGDVSEGRSAYGDDESTGTGLESVGGAATVLRSSSAVPRSPRVFCGFLRQ